MTKNVITCPKCKSISGDDWRHCEGGPCPMPGSPYYTGSKPRPYDLSKSGEFDRLLSELEGYLRVSLNDGTDTSGRRFAYEALRKLNAKEAKA